MRNRLGFAGEPLPGTAEVFGTGEPASEFPADVRVLSVIFDDQGDRHKDWKAVVQESSDCSGYGDWPFEGEAVSLSMGRHFYRHDGTPLSWLDRWLPSRGIEEHERTAHEMRALLSAF